MPSEYGPVAQLRMIQYLYQKEENAMLTHSIRVNDSNAAWSALGCTPHPSIECSLSAPKLKSIADRRPRSSEVVPPWARRRAGGRPARKATFDNYSLFSIIY
jgi:hypothetical protein